MNIRIGKNTAGAAGASLMDMANFLRQGDQIQNSQAATKANLVDQMARRLLEQERQEKDEKKAEVFHEGRVATVPNRGRKARVNSAPAVGSPPCVADSAPAGRPGARLVRGKTR